MHGDNKLLDGPMRRASGQTSKSPANSLTSTNCGENISVQFSKVTSDAETCLKFPTHSEPKLNEISENAQNMKTRLLSMQHVSSLKKDSLALYSPTLELNCSKDLSFEDHIEGISSPDNLERIVHNDLELAGSILSIQTHSLRKKQSDCQKSKQSDSSMAAGKAFNFLIEADEKKVIGADLNWNGGAKQSPKASFYEEAKDRKASQVQESIEDGEFQVRSLNCFLESTPSHELKFSGQAELEKNPLEAPADVGLLLKKEMVMKLDSESSSKLDDDNFKRLQMAFSFKDLLLGEVATKERNLCPSIGESKVEFEKLMLFKKNLEKSAVDASLNLRYNSETCIELPETKKI